MFEWAIKIKEYIEKFKKNENKHEIDFKFEDLTPKIISEKNDVYFLALDQALENKEILNIALTGPYGSGKSSILKTYIQKRKWKYKFTNISLLTLNDKNSSSDKEADDKEKENIEKENELEKGILQQLFYQVKNKKVPYSGIKRIKNQNSIWIITKILFFLLFLFSIFLVYFPNLINKTYSNEYILDNNHILELIEFIKDYKKVCLIIIFIGILRYLFLIHRWIYTKFKISKISHSKTSIELDPGSETSIFSKYIDEILYLFEVTKNNVIIFEDLDRFNNLDIFENLRELNLLINNSKQIGRKIVFIYAIKDDLFGEEDDLLISRNRTKFFDFIIPVIPIINSSNSATKLWEKISAMDKNNKVEERFVNDLALYIDDMRTLINICNEFYIYKDQLKSLELNLNKLLAIIVYKNIYPIDFAKLQFNKGMVYKVFFNKKNLIEEKVENIKTQILELESDIEEAENEVSNNIEELQFIYSAIITKNIFNDNVLSSYSSGERIKIEDTEYYQYQLKNDFFDALRKAEFITIYTNNRRGEKVYKNDLSVLFGQNKDYFKRENLLELKQDIKLNLMRSKIESLNKEKERIENQSLKNLVDDSVLEDIKEEKLLVFLLRSGYIDEMYSQYITYFYPGSLRKEDMDFIFSVKNRENLPHNYKLSNMQKIMSYLDADDFENIELLNFNLLDYLIINVNIHKLAYDNFILQMINDPENNLKFIDEYKEISVNKGFFINSICTAWQREDQKAGFWEYIQLESNYTLEKKKEYMVDIISYTEIEKIHGQNNNGLLKEFIEGCENFLELFNDKNVYSNIQNVLINLRVKFPLLKPISEMNELYDFIIKKNLHQININMITLIINSFKENISEQIIASDKNIKKAGIIELENYLGENINDYVQNVFLEIKENFQQEDTIIEFLNNANVEEDNIKKIINKQEILISDISKVPFEKWVLLFENMKVIGNWENLILYYEKNNNLDEIIIDFLNKTPNKFSLLESIEEDKEETIKEITKNLIEKNDITNETFKRVVPNKKDWIVYDISDIPLKRIELLINNGILTLDHYDEIKEISKKLLVLLIIKYIGSFLESNQIFEIGNEEVREILISDEVKKNEKSDLISQLSIENIELLPKNEILAQIISSHIIKNKLEISSDLYENLLHSDINQKEKVVYFEERLLQLDPEQIDNQLVLLGLPYSLIAERGKRPTLSSNNINYSIAQKLKEIDYISSYTSEKEEIRINTKRNN